MPALQFFQTPKNTVEAAVPIDAIEIRQAFTESRTLQQLWKHGQDHLAVLSSREMDVLRHVAAGHPNKMIALQLNISVKTVEKYRGNVMKKLRVKTLPDLMRIWLQANPQELKLTRHEH
ncbi:MAG: LuxR C-terminal-related transcriptional regulator [Planctomycetaceae bacterium]